jgi:hypothetical protein
VQSRSAQMRQPELHRSSGAKKRAIRMTMTDSSTANSPFRGKSLDILPSVFQPPSIRMASDIRSAFSPLRPTARTDAQSNRRSISGRLTEANLGRYDFW